MSLENTGAARAHPVANEFVFSRTFDAPKELVWQAWTQAEHMMNWWGPKGFKMKVAKLDLRPGGMFHYAMTGPDGSEMWGKFVYTEIVPPDVLGFIVSFSDPEGGTTTHPFSATWPKEVKGRMVLTEENGRTTITSTSWPINADSVEEKTFLEGHKGMEAGYTGTLDQLAAYLAKLQEA